MSNNSTPFEIISAPFTLWLAPVGTAFPAIDLVTPASPWAKVGTSGDLNYTEDGVTVSQPQTTKPFRALGDMAPRKIFRTEEDLLISLKLADLTLEQYANALNSNAVTTVAAGSGTAGYKKIGLSRGTSIATVAMLLRGPSPYGDDMYMQYEVPRAQQSGNPQIVFRNNGEPAALSLEWTALVDPNAVSVAERFGRLIAMNAVAL